MPRSNNSSGVYCPKYKNLRSPRLSRSAHVPDPGQVRNGYGRAKVCLSRPPRTCFVCSTLQTSSKTNKRSSPTDGKQNKRSRVCHRKIQNRSNYRLEMMPVFVNHPGAADIKVQPKYPKFLLDMLYFCNFSLISLGIRPRSRRCTERTRQGEGR